jgi:hypothetical protein
MQSRRDTNPRRSDDKKNVLPSLFLWKPLADAPDVKIPSLDLFCETSQSALGVFLSVPVEPPDQQHWQAAALLM